MAEFGIEAIRYFKNARAAGVTKSGDLTYTFNRSNGFQRKLSGRGHTQNFYYVNTDAWETDIRDADQGGEDNIYVDAVDIFWIETHGDHDSAGRVVLQYDIAHTAWITRSNQWQLGEGFDNEWVMAFSCNTVDRNNVFGLANIFAGMHIYCGAYGFMYDGWTTDECGEDVGDNLIDGDTVSYSWHDGVSDWWVDNHPITVCPADAATWNNGSIRWDLSFINRDHLLGEGEVLPDLPPAQRVAFLWKWSEG